MPGHVRRNGGGRERAVEFRPTCDGCGDVIGVYEAVVVIVDGQTRVSSRAADPGLAFLEGRRYHRACYLKRGGVSRAGNGCDTDGEPGAGRIRQRVVEAACELSGASDEPRASETAPRAPAN